MAPERQLSTAELVRRAVEETKLLAKAEVEHAKQELRDDLGSAKVAAVLLGVGVGLGLCGLSLLFVALALTFMVPPRSAVFWTGLVLLVLALTGMGVGVGRIPKR